MMRGQGVTVDKIRIRITGERAAAMELGKRLEAIIYD
jgi:hypothetical protein